MSTGFDPVRGELPGGRAEAEDSDTPALEHAEYWVRFYSDLVRLQEEVLETMRRLASQRPEPARVAVEQGDIQPLLEQTEALKQRLRFWQDRRRELSSRS
jgi:hypothetical protein